MVERNSKSWWLVVGGVICLAAVVVGGLGYSQLRPLWQEAESAQHQNGAVEADPPQDKRVAPGVAKRLVKDHPKDKPEKTWPRQIRNSIGLRLVRIPPGTFKMGSPEGEMGRDSDEKQHEVEFTKEFWLGIHEVTQKQFKAVMGYHPSYFSRDGTGKEGVSYIWQPAGAYERLNRVPEDTSDFPVENVSWDEAKEFCDKLTTKEGGGRKYRLPTEAEWEYSCRGGAPSYQVFHFGNSLSSKQANFYGNYPYGGADKGDWLNRTREVGSYEENGFGLFDMHGNVQEWCSDWYAEDYGKSRRTNPSGPAEGVYRVFRGGGWGDFGWHCRSAHRIRRAPAYLDRDLGFRVALVPSGRSSK
jgi:formylglycine-generating enzyme required for sulfatase activity